MFHFLTLLPHFNSIKVRLKLIYGCTLALGFLFQFHKGTIKTEEGTRYHHVAYVFQFHKGTIKTAQDGDPIRCTGISIP